MIRLQRYMTAGLEGPHVQPPTIIGKLQMAIKLEHSTIPLYLYALYSLDEDKNSEIADILQSVVIEEMLHITLASNILNALGGAPVIDESDFIPTYPGALPGGVEADLTVHLAPFSTDQLKVFLTIEEPENPLNFPVALGVDPTITIGQFYAAISKAIGQLPDDSFAKSPRNQVGPELVFGSIVVTDVASAQAAITTIVGQGEGTTESPEEGAGQDYAHYYRFMQIEKGHKLVPVPGESDPEKMYAYIGDPIVLDAAGVYKVPKDPAYLAGSTQAAANDSFNYTYTSLLKALHDLFNGANDRQQMRRAIGLMMSLKEQAKAMMSGIPDPTVLAGPSFEYRPVNPAAQGVA